jgi:hypothetical protein
MCSDDASGNPWGCDARGDLLDGIMTMDDLKRGVKGFHQMKMVVLNVAGRCWRN